MSRQPSAFYLYNSVAAAATGQQDGNLTIKII